MPITFTEQDFEDTPAFSFTESDFEDDSVTPSAAPKPADKAGILDLGLEEWLARKFGMRPKPSMTQSFVFPTALPAGGMVGTGTPPVSPTETMLPVPLPKTSIRAEDLPVRLPRTAGAYTAEAINQALGLAQFATSPLGLTGTAGGLLGPAVAIGTTADVATQIPELAQRAGTVSATPSATPEEQAKAYLGLAAPIVMPALPVVVGAVMRGDRPKTAGRPIVEPKPTVPAVEPAKPSLETQAELRQQMAADVGEAATPVEAPAAVPDAIAALPPVPEGKVRLYHGEGALQGGGDGGAFYTTSAEKAATFGPKVQYVDVSPEEAAAARQKARASGQGGDTAILTKESLKEAKPVPGEVVPKVYDLEAPVTETAKPASISEQVSNLMEMPVDELKAYKGKNGSGPTGMAWDIGAEVKTPEDVATLKAIAEKSAAESKALMKAGKFDEAMALAGRQPAEAYEFATGVKLDGTPKWETFEKRVPGYKPSVPDAKYLEAKGIKPTEALAVKESLTAQEPKSTTPAESLPAEVPKPIKDAATVWRKAEKRWRRAKRQDPPDVESADEARQNAEIQFRQLTEETKISQKQYDELIRYAKETETETRPEETIPPPEPRSPQALGIAPEGTSTAQAAIDWVKDTPNKARVIRSQLAGKAAPRTSTASEASGNALVRYASSNIAAPLIGKSMATEVLGPRYKDTDFANRLGALLVEDRLRAIKDGFERAGDADGAAAVETAIGKDWSPLRSEADFQAALSDPEIRAAIDRHKATVQPAAQLFHEETGGQLAGPGLNTGAFVNLKAIFPDAPEVPFGQGGRGNLENPLKKPSRFGKRAAGTAEQYETDYRALSERMISGNYAEYTKRQMYDQLVKDGLAVYGDAGQKAPTLGGKKTVRFTIERYNAPNRNIWVREDVVPEVRQALNTDGAVGKAGLTAAANLINRIQLAGPTDAVWHTANMLGSIAGSQGGRTVLADLARKLPGVNIADAVTRVVASSIRVLRDTPEIQKQLSELGQIGAMRAKQESGHPVLDFNHRVIALVDRAGRLVRDDLYQNLVQRGLVRASEAGRREWVNQMGQYNGRLMGQFQRFFKEAGFSPFIVAGRNFNRMAMRRLTGSPGVEASSMAAALEMRAIEWLGTAATLFAVPAAINYFLTGTPQGRPGVKMGQIDTGKDKQDGSHIVIDPAQWTGLRRGLRITGLQAAGEGLRRGDTKAQIQRAMGRDILGGIVHPWAGPAVSAATVTATGRSPTGYQESNNPYDYGENLKSALKQLNPLAESILKSREKDTSPVSEMTLNLSGAAGIKGARPYTPSQQISDKVNQWMDENGLKTKGIKMEFTDDPSYHTLRQAVQDNNKPKFEKIISELEKTKGIRKIIDAQRQFADRPFTGSEDHEKQFLRSLSESDRDLYWKAREQRKEELKKFYQMLP